VSSSYGTALFVGDPVSTEDGGGTGGTTDATGRYNLIEKATLADTNYTIGPIVGIVPNPDNLNRNYIPASTGGYVWVADDPNLIFEIQVDDASGPIAITDFMLNAIMVETHAGSTITGISGIELDEDSITANSSLMLLVLRLVDREDNELAAHCKVEVLISTHQYGFTGSDYGRMGIT